MYSLVEIFAVVLSVFAALCGLAVLRLGYLYVKWVTNPLHKIPWGPRGAQENTFLWGAFPTIRKSPFMEPHKEWWKQQIECCDNDDVPMLHYTGFLGGSTLVVLDKDIVKDILTAPAGTDNRRYTRNGGLLANKIGDGLVTLEGKDWMRHRQIITPAFRNTNFLRDTLQTNVPPKVNRLIKYWQMAAASASQETKNATIDVGNQQQRREIDLTCHLSALTLDIIGDVAFSHEFRALDSVQKWAENLSNINDENNDQQQNNKIIDDDDNNNTNNKLDEVDDPLIKACIQTFKFTKVGTFFFLLGSPWLDRYVNPRTTRIRKIADNAVDEIIQNAKKKNNEVATTSSSSSNDTSSASNNGEQHHNEQSDDTTSLTTSKYHRRPKSLLQLLLQARDDENTENNNTESSFTNSISSSPSTKSSRTLNDTELREEVKTFMFAGHETTSTLVYWAIYALCIYPDIQERVYQEISSCCHLNDKHNKEHFLVLDDIEKLEYFNAFINEVLRLFPPVGMLVRYSRYEETIHNFKVPKNTRFNIAPHLLHRHPKYWGNSSKGNNDDPELFQPERWIHNSNKEQEEFMNRIRFVYLPFGAGSRNCIGQRFATIEAKLILSNLIRSFTFQIAPSQRDTKFTFTNFITMKTKPSIKIVVQSR